MLSQLAKHENSASQAASCKHCGLSLAGQTVYGEGFCCRGCEMVYVVLKKHNLDDFYTLRAKQDSWTPTQPRITSSDFAYYDDPAFVERFSRPCADGSRSICLHLEGIHCAACIWLLEKIPEFVPGISDCRIQFARSTAQVAYDPSKTSCSKIAQSLNSLGYHPYPLAYDSDRNSPSEQILYRQLAVAGFCAGNIMLLSIARYEGLFTGIEHAFDAYFAWISFLLAIPVILYSAIPFFKNAWNGLRFRRLHIDLPITLALIGAFVISSANVLRGLPENYFDSISALVFLLLAGRAIQRSILRRATDATSLLHSITPIYAHKIDDQGGSDVFVESLLPGDMLRVLPGEKFPADGTIIEGQSQANNAILTGESEPQDIVAGSRVFAGTENNTTPVVLKVERVGSASRIGSLVCQIETSASTRSRIVELTNLAGGYFVATVLLLCVAIAFIWQDSGSQVVLDRILALLVVTCPCALAIATPISISLSAARAARRGIMVVGHDVFERSAVIKHVVFDKTGTITEGRMTIHKAAFDSLSGYSKQQLCSYLLSLEIGSNHPAAITLRHYAIANNAEQVHLTNHEELPGMGVRAADEMGNLWQAGTFKWLGDIPGLAEQLKEVADLSDTEALTLVLLAQNGRPVAAFAIGDTVRAEAAEVISSLKELGITIALCSGDREIVVKSAASQLGIKDSDASFELMPEGKVSLLKNLRQVKPTAMIGDGVNDAAALREADLGIAMHGGAEVCLRVADVFLAQSDLRKVPLLLAGSRKAMGVVYRNLAISVVYNLTGAVLAVSGLVGPLLAAFLMPISSLTVVLSSYLSDPFKISFSGSARQDINKRGS